MVLLQCTHPNGEWFNLIDQDVQTTKGRLIAASFSYKHFQTEVDGIFINPKH